MKGNIMNIDNDAMPQQEFAGRKTMTRDFNKLSFLFQLLGLILILVVFAVSTVNAMKADRMEDQLEQMEDRLNNLETQLTQIQEAAGSQSTAEAKESENTSLPTAKEQGLHSIAHRGFSAEAPENTLPAFLLAWQHGFKYVEADIQFTADGYPVCLHDQWIDRTSNGSGRIDWITLEQVREYDFGTWMSEKYAGTQIPTFEEFIILCRNLNLHAYIELKAETVTCEKVPDLVKMVKAFNMEKQVSWISFSHPLLETVRECDENARIGYLVKSLGYNEITTAILLAGTSDNVFIDSSVYSETECRLCRENSIPLEVWTLDSVEDILSLDPYISGVTSNCLIAEDVRQKKVG